jgi:hypothetical protein
MHPAISLLPLVDILAYLSNRKSRSTPEEQSEIQILNVFQAL